MPQSRQTNTATPNTPAAGGVQPGASLVTWLGLGGMRARQFNSTSPDSSSRLARNPRSFRAYIERISSRSSRPGRNPGPWSGRRAGRTGPTRREGIRPRRARRGCRIVEASKANTMQQPKMTTAASTFAVVLLAACACAGDPFAAAPPATRAAPVATAQALPPGHPPASAADAVPPVPQGAGSSSSPAPRAP
jgi:hypothetical protein